MSTINTMTLDHVSNVIPFKEAVEGWKWAGSTLKEVLEQDHEAINRQNEGFMNLAENPDTVDDRYKDASQHLREIRDYKRAVTRDVITAVTIVSLALCGVKTISVRS